MVDKKSREGQIMERFFGIVWALRLAEELDIPQEEANALIRKYALEGLNLMGLESVGVEGMTYETLEPTGS